MKAIILAAGLGTRLRPMTDNKPKCMVKVSGKPILQHQIDAYIAAGVDKIIVVTGYMGDVVEAFCSAYTGVVKCVRNADYATTNNMYSLYLALQDQGQETYMLSNGDVVYNPEIISEIFRAEGSYVAADKGSYTDESMKIVVENDRVADISKQIKAATAYGNSIDLYKFDQKVADNFEKGIKNIIETEKNLNEWTELALQKMLLSGEIQLSPFDIEKRDWVEIDDYDDLAVADEKFSNLNIDDIKLLFIDLDGTLYLGDEVIEGAADFINRVKASGKLFKLFSNNSSKNKKQYVEKLARYGVSVSEESIILSTDGAIAHLTNTGVKSVYVVGTEALREAVESAGIKTTSESYEMVLIGYDTELTYSKLAKASLLIHQGCSYMATHSDVVCPTAEGPIPDIGSMIALIEKATGTPPEKIFGKPSAEMVNHILKSMDVDPKHVVFIGDRLYTDMVMAQNVGAKFVLVLSGEAKREDVEEMVDNPDLIIPSVAKLL